MCAGSGGRSIDRRFGALVGRSRLTNTKKKGLVKDPETKQIESYYGSAILFTEVVF